MTWTLVGQIAVLAVIAALLIAGVSSAIATAMNDVKRGHKR